MQYADLIYSDLQVSISFLNIHNNFISSRESQRDNTPVLQGKNPVPCERQLCTSHLNSKTVSVALPSLDPSFPFSILLSPVRFSGCFFPGFLAIFAVFEQQLQAETGNFVSRISENTHKAPRDHGTQVQYGVSVVTRYFYFLDYSDTVEPN